MDVKQLLTGPLVSLPEVLAARERRVEIQQRLQRQYPMPLISFTLNIAGPVKAFALAVKTYEEGVELIRCECKARGIVLAHSEAVCADTGCESFFCAQAPAEKIKLAMAGLEQSSSLGRLFDIDVLDTDGRKLSRTEVGLPERSCLLCGQPAFVCSRSRAHSIEQLLERTATIMWDYFAERYAARTASAACRALLYEVLATPKPGLVDKQNTGSHTDMDIVTFESSALALLPYLKAFVTCGIDHCTDDPGKMLARLRPAGLQAEVEMLRATGGVNTHKGIIFSLGILGAALGVCYGNGRPADRCALQKTAKGIAAPLLHDFDGVTAENAVSNGEKLYAAYGVRGVRGEAADGYPTLFETALPRMDGLAAAGYSANDCGVLTLLSILAAAQDTNLIIRSSYDEACRQRERLAALVAADIEHRDYLALAQQLDREFIDRQMSPGGSADLLALTYFLRFLEQDGLMTRPQESL